MSWIDVGVRVFGVLWMITGSALGIAFGLYLWDRKVRHTIPDIIEAIRILLGLAIASGGIMVIFCLLSMMQSFLEWFYQ
jgi:hypothetical protein